MSMPICSPRALFVLAGVVLLLAGPVHAAEPLRVATWNVHEGFTVEGIRARSTELSAFAARVRPDVLIIEEVVSQQVAEAVRDTMGLTGYHVACSDFNPTDAPDFGALEVAVLSRYPITQAIEYDTTPDNDSKPNSLPELPISPLVKLGMQRPLGAGGIRGFLWARIDDLQLTVVAVHLKSSRGADGDDDRGNAERREFIAAAVADSVAQDLRLFPTYTALVAGDFNVGHSDPKNGRNPAREDVQHSATTDGYDETHAIFGGGLLGLKMRNLTGAVRDSTFPAIPSTPIDNIYVVGTAADKFAPAQLERETFGSDHRPVVALWNVVPHKPAVPPPSFAVTTPAKSPSAAGKTPPLAPSAGGPAIPVSEAAKHLNGPAVVEFTVRAVNVQGSPPVGFINSEADYRSDDNFTVVVFSDGLDKFRAAGVADLAAHFQGKKIRVSGTVGERRGRYQITVADPRQIEIVP
jgi:endonuclease/exonuclease/phosphatase family metal-dependent hydrolase